MAGDVAWQHEDAVTGAMGASHQNGSYEVTNMPDPMGANLGLEEPTGGNGGIGIAKPEPAVPFLRGIGWGGSDAKCELDGIEQDCALVNQLMEAGGVEQRAWYYNSSRWEPHTLAVESLGLGLYRTIGPYTNKRYAPLSRVGKTSGNS